MKRKTFAKPFYHQWIRTERIYTHIQKIGLGEKEEKEAWSLIEETIHTRAIDAVLDKLPSEKHEEFLEKFRQKPDDTALFDYLRQHTKDIDVHLKKVFQTLEEEIIKDIIAS